MKTIEEKMKNIENFYVYKITNLINNKYYIGKRKCNCNITDDTYMGSGIAIQQALKKYGKDNFKKEILAVVESEEKAFEMEADLLTTEHVNDPFCYNLREGGLGGWSHAEDTKKIISEKLKGRHLEDEHIEKLSKSSKGKPKSESHKENIRQANIGKTYSEETKQKISNTLTGRKRLDRTNDDIRHAKIGEAHKGRKYVTNTKTQKVLKVLPEDVQKYLNEGWELGRLIEDAQKNKKKPTAECPHCKVTMSKSNLSRHIKSKHKNV